MGCTPCNHYPSDKSQDCLCWESLQDQLLLSSGSAGLTQDGALSVTYWRKMFDVDSSLDFKLLLRNVKRNDTMN